MADKCGIYKVTNQINNKSYIGKSKHISLRWQQHYTEPFNVNAKTYNTLFYRAIRKYGLENFKFEIIEECPEELLNNREKYWINIYNTYIDADNSNGYNMTKGGEFTSQELKYDIDLIEQLWNEGKTHKEIEEITTYNHNIITRYLNYLDIPIEERRKRANSYKAKLVYQYDLSGNYLSTFSSISDAVKALQKEYPKANTSNIAYACNNKISSAYGYIWSYNKNKTITNKCKHKKVNQYNLEGQYLATYNSQKEAAEKNNIKCVSAITNVCTNKSKTAGGYIWRYYDASLENPIANLTNI